MLDELNLPRHQRPQIQAALMAELNRLIAEDGLPPSLHAGGLIPRLSISLESFNQPASGESAIQTGQKIAQSVYSQLASQSSDTGYKFKQSNPTE